MNKLPLFPTCSLEGKVMVTKVCGVDNLEDASAEDLRNLLNELGRNGYTEASEKIREEIIRILDKKNEEEPKIDEGLFHYPEE